MNDDLINSNQIVEAASDFHLSDTMSLRFAGVTNSNDGNEVTNIRTGVNEGHSYDSGRLSLNWEPSDELSVRVKYQNMESDSNSNMTLDEYQLSKEKIYPKMLYHVD